MKSLTKEECYSKIEKARWPEEPICPYCFSKRNSKIRNSVRYHCNECNTSFSATVNTIFHDSKLPIQKWFQAIRIVLEKNGNITAKEIQRKIHVTYKTAWYLSVRIKRAYREQRDFLVRLLDYHEINKA